MSFKFPLIENTYDQTDIDVMIDVLRSDKLTMGKKVEQFEREFSKYIGSNSTIDGTPMPIMANSRKLDAAGNIQRAPIPPVFGDRSTVAPRAAPVGTI